jgi:hypothetical protein
MRALLPSITCAAALAACAQQGKGPPPVDTADRPSDCAAAPLDCDLQDNDCDGEIDEGAEAEVRGWVGEDADGDGWAAGPLARACPETGGSATSLQGGGDCNDEAQRIYPGAFENCLTEVDEDCDGEGACDDLDCAGRRCVEDCSDSLDNDGDGAADCTDSSCRYEHACGEDCTDGVDNNRDGAVDCYDERCRVPTCPERCGDGVDNDGDRLTDCGDSECWGPTCPEDCANSGDEDADGLRDCEDADCVSGCVEACDGSDRDEDDLIDCADPDCALRMPCWRDARTTSVGVSASFRSQGGSSAFFGTSHRLWGRREAARIEHSGRVPTTEGGSVWCALGITDLRLESAQQTGALGSRERAVSFAVDPPLDPRCPDWERANIEPHAALGPLSVGGSPVLLDLSDPSPSARGAARVVIYITDTTARTERSTTASGTFWSTTQLGVGDVRVLLPR